MATTKAAKPLTPKQLAAKDPNSYLQQALADGFIDNTEMSFLNQTKAGKSLVYQQQQAISDALKSGDYSKLNPYLTGGKATSNMFAGVDKLNSADLAGVLKTVQQAQTGKIKPDMANMSSDQQALYANIAHGLGADSLLNAQWQAETGGKNMYMGPDGQLHMTTSGNNAYTSGMGNASNLSDYQKQFIYDNYANQNYNTDGSLNAAGQQAFNKYWQGSGIADRTKALDAFNAQYNPTYKSTNQATTPSNQAPTDQTKLNEWSASNLMGTQTAPMSSQTLDGLKAIQTAAQDTLAKGDLNVPVRDALTGLINGGANATNPYVGATNPYVSAANPYIGAADGQVNQLISRLSASVDNPYLGQNNPYMQSVLDATNADITKNYNNNVMASTNAAAARGNAFGGSAWQDAQAQNEKSLATALANNTNQMRYTDYQNQQNLWAQTQQLNSQNSQAAGNLALSNNSNNVNAWQSNQNANANNWQSNQNANMSGWQANQAQNASNMLNAAGMYQNYTAPSQLGAANALMGVGNTYQNYAQQLINENLSNYQNQQNWAQNQNNALGTAIGNMGQYNNTQTGTQTGTAPGNTFGGALSNGLGAGLAAYSAFGGGFGNNGAQSSNSGAFSGSTNNAFSNLGNSWGSGFKWG